MVAFWSYVQTGNSRRLLTAIALTIASGEFESEVGVPAAAAVGAGEFSATSTLVGAVASTTFEVT